MEIQTSTGNFKDADVQALAVAVFKDEKTDAGWVQGLDAATGGLVKSVIEGGELKGKEGETVYVHLGAQGGVKAQRLLLVGAGERDAYNLAQLAQTAGTAVRALRARNVKSVGLLLRGGEGEDERAAAVAVEGVLMGLFELDKYRTIEKEERQIERLLFLAPDAPEGGPKTGAKTGE